MTDEKKETTYLEKLADKGPGFTFDIGPNLAWMIGAIVLAYIGSVFGWLV